jgi:hypothetical protein
LDFILFIYFLLCNKKEQVYTTTTCLKTWAIFGFVKGISSGFDSQQCGKAFKPTSVFGGTNKRSQAPTPFLGRTIILAKYSRATCFVNTTIDSNVTN